MLQPEDPATGANTLVSNTDLTENFDIAGLAFRSDDVHLRPFKGRGYVQITGRDNYQHYAKVLGIDLVNNPDLALEPQTALAILVNGFKTGAFTGKKITDFINEEETDFVQARRRISALDRAKEIAEIAKKFLA